MDKFKPVLAVQEGVRSGHLCRLKVSTMPLPWTDVDPSDPSLWVDARSEAYGRVWAEVKARLEAGEPAVLPADPFRPYRDPTPSEPVILFLPAIPARRS